LVVMRDDGSRPVRAAASYAISADGSTLTWVASEGGATVVRVAGLGNDTASVVVLRSGMPVQAPALSPDGSWLAFQAMPREDWEVFVWNESQTEPRRLTSEIQHDLFPRFISDGRLLAV